MFNTYHAYRIGTTDYIDKVFNNLPANAFINKGRCGIGGTTLELTNQTRCSIIVAPTLGILHDKKKSNPDLFIVFGDVKVPTIIDMLLLRDPAQKIMTTPEGLKKIMDAANELKQAGEIYEHWFLLLDECHTFITEDFRPGILRPFDYFWNFKNKAIISATPYQFSDPRFKMLDYHDIKFTDKLGEIKLVNCHSIAATLNYILTNPDLSKGNLHIFYNSVTQIAQAIFRAGLEDCNVFCANDKDGENLKKLGDSVRFYADQPDSTNFRKVNFYTSRYFEGWDLYDKDATIILVTDVHQPHTKVSVNMKLKQAAGRLRNEPIATILHLTNHLKIFTSRKPIEEYVSANKAEAKYLLERHEADIAFYTQNGIDPKTDQRLERFADIDLKTNLANINLMKFDQVTNEAYSSEIYNNINLIKQEWEAGYYTVVDYHCNRLLETRTQMKRKSKPKQLEEDYRTLLTNKKEFSGAHFNWGFNIEERIMKQNPLAYKAFQLLSLETMVNLNFNPKKVQQEIIITSNSNQQHKLEQLLAKEFKQGQRYSIIDIKLCLQQMYNRLTILNERTGEIKKAQATDLDNPHWFELKPCKMDDHKTNGYIIARVCFIIRLAA